MSMPPYSRFEDEPPTPVGPVSRRPVLLANTVTALVVAILALLRAFGVPLDVEEQVAILGVFGAAGPLIAGFIGQMFTTPVADPRDHDGRQLVPKSPH